MGAMTCACDEYEPSGSGSRWPRARRLPLLRDHTAITGRCDQLHCAVSVDLHLTFGADVEQLPDAVLLSSGHIGVVTNAQVSERPVFERPGVPRVV